MIFMDLLSHAKLFSLFQVTKSDSKQFPLITSVFAVIPAEQEVSRPLRSPGLFLFPVIHF